MQRSEKAVITKNAFANIVRGSAAAVVAIAVPPFLTRMMSLDAFGCWSLVLQIGAYIGYLDFGIQTAVSRFVAHATERRDFEQRNRIISTSALILGIAGVLGILAAFAISIVLPEFFRGMPLNLIAPTRLALVLVSLSLAVGLPASIINGIFVGLQRNEIPAFTIGLSRGLGAVLQVFIVAHGGTLAWMAGGVAGANLLSYFMQYWMYHRFASGFEFSRRFICFRAVRELSAYCASLTVWSFAMLLVGGLDVVLVGAFQFKATAYYAVAASLVAFVIGLQNAVFSALLSPAAVLHARGDSDGLGRMVVSATRYGMFLLFATGLPLIFFSRSILNVWVGKDYAQHGALLLEILVMANIIRLSATPYAIALLGSGQQRLVIVTPLLEGFTNLLASLIGGLHFGAVGVAWGTFIGALVGVGGNFLCNMPRTTEIQFRIRDYVCDGLLRPCACAVPGMVLGILLSEIRKPSPFKYPALAGAVFFTAVLLWRYGLIQTERENLRVRYLVPQG